MLKKASEFFLHKFVFKNKLGLDFTFEEFLNIWHRYLMWWYITELKCVHLQILINFKNYY